MRDRPQTMAMQQLQGSGLTERLRDYNSMHAAKDMMEAAARIEALEKALRDIVEAGDFWEMDSIARAALAPEQDK